MEITRVVIAKRTDLGTKVRARCSVVLDNVLKLNHISIIDGVDGIFISMPYTKLSPQGANEVFHSVNKEFFQYLKSTIISVYEESLTSDQLIYDVRFKDLGYVKAP